MSISSKPTFFSLLFLSLYSSLPLFFPSLIPLLRLGTRVFVLSCSSSPFYFFTLRKSLAKLLRCPCWAQPDASVLANPASSLLPFDPKHELLDYFLNPFSAFLLFTFLSLLFFHDILSYFPFNLWKSRHHLG